MRAGKLLSLRYRLVSDEFGRRPRSAATFKFTAFQLRNLRILLIDIRFYCFSYTVSRRSDASG
jgi:hypothetical protein